jgi:hypothetical protein
MVKAIFDAEVHAKRVESLANGAAAFAEILAEHAELRGILGAI